MKMVKSLLLGSAAGLVAVAGAQAADLPVKAKPVEYVKVCSLYGAGYYYMPGTDICMKIGGYIRFQFSGGTSEQTRPALVGPRTRDTVAGAEYGWRTRAVVSFDTRQQTAYGTLRTYTLIGFQETNGTVALYATRGFIQFAGFTFGKATSFFDHFPTAGRAYFAGNFHNSSTGDGGWNVAAYTAEFGNGVSATIALEQSRSGPTVSQVSAGAFPAVFTGRPLHGNLRGYPDVVANLRVDQAWGSAMIGGALHDASASYYNGLVAAGHPGHRMGWAATAATQINLPMISPGSSFNAQFIYTQGAVQYASHTSAGTGIAGISGDTIYSGLYQDAVFGGIGTSIELTTAWSLALAYEHVLAPGSEDLPVRQLPRRVVQRRGDQPDLRRRCGGCGPGGRWHLQPELGCVERRQPHRVGAGSWPHPRRGRGLQPHRELGLPQPEWPHPGHQPGFGLPGHQLCHARPELLGRHVPHPAQLPALIGRRSATKRTRSPAGNRRGFSFFEAGILRTSDAPSGRRRANVRGRRVARRRPRRRRSGRPRQARPAAGHGPGQAPRGSEPKRVAPASPPRSAATGGRNWRRGSTSTGMRAKASNSRQRAGTGTCGSNALSVCDSSTS